MSLTKVSYSCHPLIKSNKSDDNKSKPTTGFKNKTNIPAILDALIPRLKNIATPHKNGK